MSRRAAGARRGAAGAAVAALALLSGCGTLDSPDLRTGRLEGKVSSTSASGGYVYVLGAPERKGVIDSEGEYEIRLVPAGDIQVVVVAPAGGSIRAEVVPVTVLGGMKARLDRDASAMPLAGRIVAAVQPVGGALASAARFTVERTVHQAVVGSGAVLGDLPAGTWTLSISLQGYRSRTSQVSVDAGLDTTWDQVMDVDDADTHPGCGSSTCDNGLHCNPADGQCYACLDDSQCGTGEHCDSGAGGTSTCVEDAGQGGFCVTADSVSRCAGPSPRLVPITSSLGYCSTGCSVPGECPAGWSCAGSPGTCTVKVSCRENAETFGSSCAHDSACSGELFGGKCLRLSEDSAGFCTAPCTTDQQCVDAGFGTCRAEKDGVRYCQR